DRLTIALAMPLNASPLGSFEFRTGRTRHSTASGAYQRPASVGIPSDGHHSGCPPDRGAAGRWVAAVRDFRRRRRTGEHPAASSAGHRPQRLTHWVAWVTPVSGAGGRTGLGHARRTGRGSRPGSSRRNPVTATGSGDPLTNGRSRFGARL